LDYGNYGRIKRKMTIGKNIDVQKVGNKNLEELAKLTILNILSVKGIIYTHYKNKSRFRHNEKHLVALEESLIKNITSPYE
tara:strand:+ start:612 stop:854 length:243 start_codon:yes stop_codon:yes gene_type:complete